MGNPRWPPGTPRHYDTAFVVALRMNVNTLGRGSDSPRHINTPNTHTMQRPCCHTVPPSAPPPVRPPPKATQRPSVNNKLRDTQTRPCHPTQGRGTQVTPPPRPDSVVTPNKQFKVIHVCVCVCICVCVCVCVCVCMHSEVVVRVGLTHYGGTGYGGEGGTVVAARVLSSTTIATTRGPAHTFPRLTHLGGAATAAARRCRGSRSDHYKGFPLTKAWPPSPSTPRAPRHAPLGENGNDLEFWNHRGAHRCSHCIIPASRSLIFLFFG